MKKNWMYSALVAVVLSGSHSLWGQTPVVLGDYVFTAAEDMAANYPITGNFTSVVNGSNEGYGFGNLSVHTVGQSFFGVSENLVSGFPAFIFANQADLFGTASNGMISRSFSELKTGDIIMLNCQLSLFPGAGAQIRVKLLNASNQSVFELRYDDGMNTNKWRVFDGSVETEGESISTDLKTFEFTYNGSDSYSYSFGTDSGTVTTLLDVSTITSIEIYTQNLGQLVYFGFNNLKIESKHTVGLSTDGSSSDFVLNTATTADQTVTAPLFEIRNGSTLTVPATGSLQIDGELQHDGALLLESVSDDFSSFMFGNSGSLDAASTGTVTYKRHVNGIPANDLLASPVGAIDFDGTGGFADLNTGVLPENGNLRLFGPYNTGTNAFTNWDITNATTISSGVGYRASARTAAGAPTPVLSFNGGLDHIDDDIPVALAYGSDVFNWNLIGNPYPSYLDIATFLGSLDESTDNVSQLDSEYQAIYGYKQTASTQSGTDKWEIVNLATIIGEDPITSIAPGQGFFVRSANPLQGPAKSITFTPAMQTKTGGDDFMVGRSAAQTHAGSLKLKLENGSGNVSHTRFYFLNNATDGLDPGYDAGLFLNALPDYGLYSLLPVDNQGVPLGVQSLHPDSFTNAVIPLGVEATAGMQLTFSIANSTLPENVDVFLHDTHTQTHYNLKQHNYVVTVHNNSTGAGRFYLNLQQQTLSTANEAYAQLQVRAPKGIGTVLVTGQVNEALQLELFDITGRSVLKQTLQTGLIQQEIRTDNLATGAFIARLSGSEGSKSFKLIIN